MLYFSIEMLVASAKSNLSCAAGCGLTGRIMLGSFSDRPRIVNDAS